MVVSAYNMILLSLERYSAIVNPMKCDTEKVLKVGTRKDKQNIVSFSPNLSLRTKR